MIFILLSSIFDLYFDSQYSNYVTFAWNIWLVIMLISHLKFKGINDELSETILSKVNKMSMNFIFVSIPLIGMFATTPRTSYIFKSVNSLGLVIIITLLLLTIFRLLSYIYYDRKVLYN
ncbi:hypothetical protein UT300012_35910 [Paraclostridium bifermentans]|jgi:hypothetical protein|nr:hypothetical protein DVA85_29640 [Acinetobacter sp. RIT592]